MHELTFHVAALPRNVQDGPLHVALYEAPASPGVPRIGGPILEAVRRLGVTPSAVSFDLLTVALAVTAADTFIRRAVASDVGWGRELHLSVPVGNPDALSAVSPLLREALGFLTGDRWRFEFREGGIAPPAPMRHGAALNLRGVDSVSLFSGGLDSAIGVLDLVEQELHPLLVSHAYPADARKQIAIRHSAFPSLPRFAANLRPCWPGSGGFDTTMRGRSFNFLALAAVASSVVAETSGNQVRLVVPENGFIAVNAPLSKRRIGSLSTRTTHPHFLRLMQGLFDTLGVPAHIDNPYEFRTKGEMVQQWRRSNAFSAIAAETVSCGKWKRRHVQCGRCVPCLIRRASFHAASLPDPTPRYESPRLPVVLADGDPAACSDLLAIMGATKLLDTSKLRARVGASGPMPTEPAQRAMYEDVVGRGLQEAKAYLQASGITV